MTGSLANLPERPDAPAELLTDGRRLRFMPSPIAGSLPNVLVGGGLYGTGEEGPS